MTLIKKIDVEKHFAARRAMRLGRTQAPSRLGVAGIKSTAKRNRVPAPAEGPALGSFPASSSAGSMPARPHSGGNRLLKPPGTEQR